MTEQELRALVRDALARQGAPFAGGVAGPALAVAPPHASHGMFALPAGGDPDGPCLIEPAVMCNHCGYCRSYGH